MLKNLILFKTDSLQSALHIVVCTYLEVLAGHKIKDCRLVVTWVEMLSECLSFYTAYWVMEHFGNEPSVNVSYASFLCNFTISSSPQNKSEALAFYHLRPLTD